MLHSLDRQGHTAHCVDEGIRTEAGERAAIEGGWCAEVLYSMHSNQPVINCSGAPITIKRYAATQMSMSSNNAVSTPSTKIR